MLTDNIKKVKKRTTKSFSFYFYINKSSFLKYPFSKPILNSLISSSFVRVNSFPFLINLMTPFEYPATVSELNRILPHPLPKVSPTLSFMHFYTIISDVSVSSTITAF